MPDEPSRSPLDAFRAPGADDEIASPVAEEIEDTDDAGENEAETEADEIDPAFYANGGISLSGAEQEVLGELHGRRVLMVGAGNGEDAASLANLGATLTVVDDEESIEAARALVADAGLTAEFLIDEPGALSVDLRSGDFDVVYSGFGAIDWMDNLGDWAGGVADCLRKGGRLIAYDEHPLSYVFAAEDGRLRVAYPYFGTSDPGDAESADDHSDGDADEADNGPTWTMGDIITALGANGLATISLLELRESDRFESTLDRLDEVDYEEVSRTPGAFLLVAVKL
jgi:SAM-dependent methyltransferase